MITGRKRRNSEDEEMADALTIKPATVRRSFKCVKLSENSKRNQKRSTRGALLGNISFFIFTQYNSSNNNNKQQAKLLMFIIIIYLFRYIGKRCIN